MHLHKLPGKADLFFHPFIPTLSAPLHILMTMKDCGSIPPPPPFIICSQVLRTYCMHARTYCDLTLGENDTKTANQFLIAATIPLRPQAVCVGVMSERVHFTPGVCVCVFMASRVCARLVCKRVNESVVGIQ